MATLTLTAGVVTATKTAPNATVLEVIDDYIAAQIERTPQGQPINAPETAQEKADWFLAHLVRHVIEVANGQNVRAAVKTADETARAGIGDRKWE